MQSSAIKCNQVQSSAIKRDHINEVEHVLEPCLSSRDVRLVRAALQREVALDELERGRERRPLQSCDASRRIRRRSFYCGRRVALLRPQGRGEASGGRQQLRWRLAILLAVGENRLRHRRRRPHPRSCLVRSRLGRSGEGPRPRSPRRRGRLAARARLLIRRVRRRDKVGSASTASLAGSRRPSAVYRRVHAGEELQRGLRGGESARRG